MGNKEQATKREPYLAEIELDINKKIEILEAGSEVKNPGDLKLAKEVLAKVDELLKRDVIKDSELDQKHLEAQKEYLTKYIDSAKDISAE